MAIVVASRSVLLMPQIADARFVDTANAKLVGLLEVGYPKGEGCDAWHVKEAVRSIDAVDDPELAAEFVVQLGINVQDESIKI